MTVNKFDLHPEDAAFAENSRGEISAETKLYSERFNDADPVNHPSHYTAYKGVEVIQLTEQMNFNKGNVVKYISRAGLKNPDKEIEDLEKAKWYLQREIERLKGFMVRS